MNKSDDTISRQDAIEAIARDIPFITFTEDPKRTAQRIIGTVPSAESKTGEWIKATGMMPPEFHGHHCCSECGAFANMDAPFGNREDLSDYCHNCGLKMVREDGEEE